MPKGIKGFQKGHKSFWSEETKKKFSENHPRYWLGKKRDDPDYLLKISLAHKGQHNSPATEFKKGQIHPKEWQLIKSEKQKANKHYNWQGGITSENKIIRRSLKMRNWRKAIFKRDNYTCQICQGRGGYLNADHIKSFALFPNLRFELSNGRTLCVPCHRNTDTYGRQTLVGKKS